jgi:Mor family transcriptional regulator
MKKILGVNNNNVFYLSLGSSLFNNFSNEMIYSVMPAFS